jgi:hypothetical protein
MYTLLALQDKFVFPTELGVTKLSGTGSDCVFLGVMKSLPVRAAIRSPCWA